MIDGCVDMMDGWMDVCMYGCMGHVFIEVSFIP
jgi:hypothetical protein